MDFELGTIFTLDNYPAGYKFATDNGYTIEEIEPKGEERQFMIVEFYQPTEEELKSYIRQKCSDYINNISWKVERYNTQKTLNIETTDTEETYLNILQYMQYCRDYDEQLIEWWKTDPLTFDEWLKNNKTEEQKTTIL